MPPPRSADDEAAAEARELLAATGFGPAEIAVVEGQYRQNSIAFTAQSLRAHDLEDLLREARRLAGGAQLVCTLAHISPKGEKHGSDMAVNPKTGRLKNPVQRAPFRKAGKGGKWIVMQAPPAPLCESCTSTIRKHYTGVTTSPQICAGFTRLIDQYKCLVCETWHPGELAVSRGNMVCPSCGWVAGNKNARKQPGGAKRKPKPRPAPPPPPPQEPEPKPAPLPPGLPSMQSTGFVPSRSDDPFAPGAVAGFIPGAGAHRTDPGHGLGLDPDDLIKQLSKLSVASLSPGFGDLGHELSLPGLTPGTAEMLPTLSVDRHAERTAALRRDRSTGTASGYTPDAGRLRPRGPSLLTSPFPTVPEESVAPDLRRPRNRTAELQAETARERQASDAARRQEVASAQEEARLDAELQACLAQLDHFGQQDFEDL